MADLPGEPPRARNAIEARQALADTAVTALQRPPLVASEDLMQGHKAIEISHNGTLYRLQATRLGKLILTK